MSGQQIGPNPRIFGKDPAATPGASGSYPLLCHLLDTVLVAEYLWDERVRPGLKARIANVLNIGHAESKRVLMLAAGLHDVGKANPFFQYQERRGADSSYASDLHAALGLPLSPSSVAADLHSGASIHPLRRHEFISMRAVSGHWIDRGSAVRSGSGNAADWLGVLVGGHHGFWRPNEFASRLTDSSGDRLLSGGWLEQQEAMVMSIEHAVEMLTAEVPPLRGAFAAVPFVCFSGLLTIADWIASDDSIVERGKLQYQSQQESTQASYGSEVWSKTWLAERRNLLRKHAQRSLGDPMEISAEQFREAILGDFEPRPLQREVLETPAVADGVGLYIAMYPTGDGKTEAAMLRSAAEPAEGFFFGLPTMATTDAMESRLSATAQDAAEAGATVPIIKAHQFANMFGHEVPPEPRDQTDDERTDHANRSWYTTSIRKLVAPNVVGTIDQALTGALAARHITLRLFGLANHHVILDEVHTFDRYQMELLIELLHWWGATRTRVTLLSATLPEAQAREISRAYRAGATGFQASQPDDLEQIPFPEVTFPGSIFVAADSGVPDDQAVVFRKPLAAVREPQPTRIKLGIASSRAQRVSRHVEWAREKTRRYPNSPIAIISNTVADCQAIAKQLADDPSVTLTHDLICLHSSMVASHRRASEKRLLGRCGKAAHRRGFDHSSSSEKPLLIVGTQVVQASLDFDVDFLATDLAPAPDLLQRLGRSWRFDDSEITSNRALRLGTEATRELSIISVGRSSDGVEKLSEMGSAPYLIAPLRRTHEALRQEINSTTDGVVNVFQFSQPWVNASNDRDPFEVLSEEEDAQRSALAEEFDWAAKRRAAAISKAAIAKSPASAGNSTELLSHKRSRFGSGPGGFKLSDLVTLSSRPDDEELMRTRYIDTESLAVLLYDSRGQSGFFDEDGEFVDLRDLSVAQLSDSGPASSQKIINSSRCVVPSVLFKDVEDAIEATLGGRTWEPKSRALASMRPLDMKRLAGVAQYDSLVGLTKIMNP